MGWWGDSGERGEDKLNEVHESSGKHNPIRNRKDTCVMGKERYVREAGTCTPNLHSSFFSWN